MIAFALFAERSYAPLHDMLISLGYFGTFLAGFLYAYSFTAAPAASILLILAEEHSLLSAWLTAGFGALLGDLTIFYFVRHVFSVEVQKLSKERFVKAAGKTMPSRVGKILLGFSACLFIASPLPTEIGVSLLALIRNVSPREFSAIVGILHTAAILVILLAGSAIL